MPILGFNIYNPDKKVITDFSQLNVAIMEPNTNFCKHCLIPISICEKSIDEINSVFAFCTYKIKNKGNIDSHSLLSFSNKSTTLEATLLSPSFCLISL